MNGLHGEGVTLNFSSADATTAAPMVIKDADGKTRVLAANERLIVDDLFAMLAAAVTFCDVFAVADNTSTGDIIIAAFVSAAASGLAPNFVSYKHGGFSLPLGVVPSVKSTVAGTTKVTGTGRIVAVTQASGRQSWQSSINP